jgi:ACS family pantothenate transporter-like MFS transporter
MGKANENSNPYVLDPEIGPNTSQDQLIVKPLKSWKGYIWDTWELPKDQRWLLFKLDAFVLTFASVSNQLLTSEDLIDLLRLGTSSKTLI